MSSQSPWGGYTMPVIIVILGVLGITFDLVFLIAFFAVLGYFLYRMEKRVSALEGNSGGQEPRPKQGQPPAK